MSTVNKKELAILALTAQGAELGRRLKELMSPAELYLPQKYAAKKAVEHSFSVPLDSLVSKIFGKYRSIVMILATGIAVRVIAPLVKDKKTDPAVVVLDDEGKFAISLLSGHIGGANELAAKIASLSGARPVITTASDSRDTISPDMLAKTYGWDIEKGSSLTRVSSALVNNEPVGIFQDAGETGWLDRELPENVNIYADMESLKKSGCSAAIIITDRIMDKKQFSIPVVILRPESMVVGIGCNRGTKCDDINKAVEEVFKSNGLSIACIGTLATIDLKKDEAGLLEYSRKNDIPVRYFNKDTLNRTEFPSMPSPLALKHVGTSSVCEPAAILAGGSELVVPKTGYKRMITLAVYRKAKYPATTGRLFLIGIGPGAPEQMTFKAREVMAECEVMIGYKSYIEHVRQFVSHKKVFTTGMGKELERVNQALDLAEQGKIVGLLSGGDSGVYGMAGLVCEMLLHRDAEIYIEVIPGVPSVIAGSALLGAPLNGDVASISLSDYLVTWDSIVQRLHMAAKGDFVIALYNPRSQKRRTQLDEARKIIMQYRSPETPVGIVNSAYRPEQQIIISNLKEMVRFNIDMNTIIIVGNSSTITGKGMMISPRGYHTKYDLKNSRSSATVKKKRRMK